jgi:hypothetical protein
MKQTVKAYGVKYQVTFTRVGEGVNIEEVRELRFFGSRLLGVSAWMHTELGEELRKQLKI